MRLVSALHSVAIAPEPLSEGDVDNEEAREVQEDSSNAEIDQSSKEFVLNQSRALTAIVKLFKVSSRPENDQTSTALIICEVVCLTDEFLLF